MRLPSIGERAVSKENVTLFIQRFESGETRLDGLSEDTAPADIVAGAAKHGLEFTETDLGAVLKQRLFAAQRLPLGWGWPVARKLGLVRS